MPYNKVEIVDIMRGCQSREEVEKACNGLRFLVGVGAQHHSEFVRMVANKRVEYLKQTN